MRRWDRLLDSYVEEYRARKVSAQSVAYTEARLNRWGRWLKGRRPRVGIERIDAEMITHYIANCSSFRAKATVYATLSTMRGFGDYLVRQGLWRSGRAERNVLDGFSLQHTLRRTVPKSLNLDEAERLAQATTVPGPTARRDRLIILLLNGCGLRTNELCELDVAHVNRERRELVVLKAKAIDRARFRSRKHSIQNCLLIYWSTENADPCFEPALVNGACEPAMCARL